MSIVLPPFEDRLGEAIAHYWTTLIKQAKPRKGRASDRGRRSAVTGGKQMDGFCSLIHWVLSINGIGDASVYVRNKRELPGFFRPTKDWDLVVVHDRFLIAAIEFKSQRGPSFGNNFNNRTEEALGNATDLWTAYREGAFGTERLRPWLGWVMLLEDCPGSTRPVSVCEPHFSVFPEFRTASYAGRYELLLRRLVTEKLYDATAFIMSTEPEGMHGIYTEPAADLTMKKLLAGLAGHASAYMATLP
ncbi:MAG: PaeR7I family type II restriction endonuclease [Candidatus Sumerlaeaceae bacterium]